MKKVLMKGLALAFVGSLAMVGSAMALPSEWGVINPTAIDSAPSYDPAADFGYFIWTDDFERTSWHVRWMDGAASGVFGGLISLENNSGVFSQISFEAGEFFSASTTGAGYFTFVNGNDYDGIDFTVTQNVAPSYVGFDLNYNFAAMNSEFIFLGSETVASLGEDQDFAVAAPVPEPATMLLFGSGLAGLAGYGRRKIKKNK
jgi:hypothetical protein